MKKKKIDVTAYKHTSLAPHVEIFEKFVEKTIGKMWSNMPIQLKISFHSFLFACKCTCNMFDKVDKFVWITL